MKKLIQPIITLAGEGTRFKEYTPVHKPMINVCGKSIIEWTLKSLDCIEHLPPIFVVRLEQETNYGLITHLTKCFPDATMIALFEPTRGNLETALLGSKKVEGPVLFLDGDNYFDFSELNNQLDSDCCICCFNPRVEEPRWAFAVTEGTKVLEVVEKRFPTRPHLPLMGMFYFKDIKLFNQLAKETISTLDSVNGEYYMSQVVTRMCPDFDVRAIVANWVYPMGTPEDVENVKNLL